jgi:ABC-type phosphate transport system permease subunit
VTAAASLVLLVLVLLMNGIAIWLRNRYERKW